MARQFDISVDLSQLLAIGPLARARIFDNLAGSVQAVAAAGVERWQRAVLKAPLWDGERRAYSSTIHYRMTGPYSAEISSDYKYVEDIETGRPPFDLKRMLDTSMKVRTTKKGQRYLIIPMRHNTPGNSALAPAMPDNVYAEARNLGGSRITGRGVRPSGTGAWSLATHQPTVVRRNKYLWGGRLAAGMAPKLKPSHHSDPYAGMVRFETHAPGRKQSSSYLTFRIMGEWQTDRWIIPAKPGLFIAQAVAESLQRTADLDFPAAIARDVAV